MRGVYMLTDCYAPKLNLVTTGEYRVRRPSTRFQSEFSNSNANSRLDIRRVKTGGYKYLAFPSLRS